MRMRRTPRGAWRLLALLAALGLLAGACGDDDGDGTASSPGPAAPQAEGVEPGEPGTYEVATLMETFVDESRPTEAPDPAGNAPNRTLPTTIVYPQADGPFPLIVLAHGQTGNPSKLSQLMTAWASAGYVVAAPLFPLTSNQSSFETVGDFVNQPADMSFVIDQIAELNDRDGELSGRVDGDHIGAAGLSLGGATVYGFFDDCCEDDRVDAVLVMAGLLLPFDDAFEWPSIPLMIINGNGDTRGRDPYTAASAPKFLLTLEKATHSAPFEDTPDDADALVVTVTVDFWHGYLYEDEAELEALATDGNVPGVATLEATR
jgi:dienelactone hydrolase